MFVNPAVNTSYPSWLLFVLELDHLQAYITTFPKYVVVVQTKKLEFPLSLFFTLDFGSMNEEHRSDYQSLKLVIHVFQDGTNTNKFNTQSVTKINDWQPENFKQQFKFGCKNLKLANLNMPNENCVTCEATLFTTL